MTIANRVIETSTGNLSLRVDGRVAVARLLGEIDMSVADEILDVLNAVIPSISQLDIHLDEITFIDSSGVTLLVRVHQCAHMHTAPVYLHNPSANVLRLFQLTALTSAFNIR